AEGIFLSAALSGVPTFAGAVLLLKLFNSDLANHAIFFVASASILFAAAVAYLGPKFPILQKSSYEPLFFDGSLSFREKFDRWLTQTVTSQKLITSTLLLSVLSVAAISFR